MMAHPREVLQADTPDWRTGDVAMLEDMTNLFLEKEVVPHYERFEKQEMVDRETWEKAGEAGLLCASMPEAYGGAGGSYAHEAVIAEAIGHQGVDGFGLALHNSIVAPYILHYGSEEQKEKWLPRMASGELIGAIAMTEPGAGSDLQ
ncbi:MAG: acyl-CoA dehydrogenase family protein, partial [Pseudomonadota bacterium]